MLDGKVALSSPGKMGEMGGEGRHPMWEEEGIEEKKWWRGEGVGLGLGLGLERTWVQPRKRGFIIFILLIFIRLLVGIFLFLFLYTLWVNYLSYYIYLLG